LVAGDGKKGKGDGMKKHKQLNLFNKVKKVTEVTEKNKPLSFFASLTHLSWMALNCIFVVFYLFL